jgi:hypothetical protein
MRDRDAMLAALRGLQPVALRLADLGRAREARGVLASRLLVARLDARILAPL